MSLASRLVERSYLVGYKCGASLSLADMNVEHKMCKFVSLVNLVTGA